MMILTSSNVVFLVMKNPIIYICRWW